VVTTLHEQLLALGFDVALGDTVTQRTFAAIQNFQQSRGIEVTSTIDRHVLHALEETSWELGDRLLYVSKPLLRGDDVVALQQSLALLGFDPGRVDGIFGPLTESGLQEFQRNYGLDASGTLTRATLVALRRLVPRDQSRRLVTEVRQRSALIREATSRRVALGGDSPLLANLREAIAGLGLETSIVEGSDADVAQAANEQTVGLVIGVREREGVSEPVIHYYESFRFRSLHGHEMAERIAAELNGDTFGMAGPLLRNTTMTALEIIHGPGVSASLVSAVVDALPVLFHS
jgi:N-acetylmuramoyl-L-alanine amidase